MFSAGPRRAISALVLVTFTGSLVLQPVNAYAQLPARASGGERYSGTLSEIRQILHELAGARPGAAGKDVRAVGPKLRVEVERDKPAAGVDVASKVRSLRGKLREREAEIDRGFRATEKHIRDRGLPAEILARHEAALADYEKRRGELAGLAQALENAASGGAELQSAIADLGAFMAKYPGARQASDLGSLPWGAPQPNTRKPFSSRAQFKTSRLFGDTVVLAQAGSLSGISLPDMATLPATPTPEDTSATEDAPLSAAIRAQAQALENHPVKIYNWVRNNIEFTSGFGSIQGAEGVLRTRRGNAFDTASLLVALLRSAGIAARYAYGTIDLPVQQAANWLGVDSAESAVQLLAQAGVPAVLVPEGGQAISLRLEHVWVEAFVDYVPSRGAVNRVPNTWVPLDASFKQFDSTAVADLSGALALNARGVLDGARLGAICTPDQSRSVNAANLQASYDGFKSHATAYLAGLGGDLTVAGALGGRRINALDHSVFLGTLPYKTVVVGSKFAAIPDSLRWKLRYLVYANETDRGNGTAAVSYVTSLPALSGKRLTLSFVPATAADQQALDSFLPAPHADGSPVLPGEFPADLPGYLIQVAAQLRVEGQIASSGGSFVLGQELSASVGHFDPAAGAWSDAGHELVAGEYHALAVDGQGVGAADLDAVKSRLTLSKGRLETRNYAALSREEVVGDLLYQAVLGYFALVDANNAVIARASGAADVRLPSYGRAYAKVEPEFALGIVARVTFPGVALRADRLAFALAAGEQRRNAYVEQSLARASAYAHLALERALAAPGAGVSTVRALAAANAAGQPIYALTQANIAGLIGQVSLDADAKTEVSDAVAGGLRALTQTAPLAFGGYTGGGYVLEDEQTAAAAYRMSSRGAGGASGVLFPAGGMPWLALAQPAQASGGAAPQLAGAVDMAVQQSTVLAELEGTANTRWSFFGPKEEVISALFLSRLADLGAGDACAIVASLVATNLAATGGLPGTGTAGNRPPVITSVPVTVAKAGQRYEYQVVAVDPDGDAIAYRLAEAPSGVSVSSSGLISWQEPLRGSFGVTVRADDGRAYAEQRFMLVVGEGAQPLDVSVAVFPTVVNSGETVNITLFTNGGVGSVATQLAVNGVNVTVNPLGQGQVTAGPTGTYRAVATATDSQRTVTREAVFTVRAAGDATAPVALITSPADDAEITAPVNVVGTATDANFAYYKLLLRPSGAGDDSFREIGRGYQQVTSGMLGRLDPTTLANGIYDLVLQVVDVNNQSASRLITLDIYRDLKIGQFAISFEDLNVEATGIPIRVTRTYDTRKKGERLDFGFGWSVDYQSTTIRKNGVFGLNWNVIAQGLQLCLRPAGQKKINITLPTGRVERFTASNQPECASFQVPQVNTVFTPLAGTTSTLEVLNVPSLLAQGGVLFDMDLLDIWNPKLFKLTTENGFVFTLSETSGIVEVRDPFGNRLTYTANGIIHSNGQSVAFARDPQGRITAITDPQGKQIRYEYDAKGDLVRVTDRLNQISSFSYNRDHGLVDFTDPRGTIVARYTYDSEGRIVAAVDADGKAIETTHDTASNREIVKDRRGNVTTYVYDASGNVTEKIDALGNRTTYAYDALGNETTTTDANGKITNRTFDPSTGAQLTERDPLGNTISNAYDPQNKTLLRSITDPRGNATGYDYAGTAPSLISEPLGRNLSMNYSNSGNMTSSNVAGEATTFGYDAKGNRTSETDALNNQITYTYDLNGNETGRSWKRTVAGVQQTVSVTRTLDEEGRVLEETDPLGAKTVTTYNAASMPVSVTDALGRQTTFEYDNQARLTKTNYPDGTTESISYDAEGNEIARTDRAGRVTLQEYDALNRPARTLAADGSAQETIYDAVGRVWKIKDAQGRETVNEYNDASRLTSVTDPTGAITRYEYDKNGNRTRATDPKGNVIDYEYDALNRLVKTLLPPPVPGGARPTATIAWRADNRKDFEIDANGNRTSYAYDAVGRLKTVTRTVNAVSQATSFSYDEVGNRTAQTDAENHQTKWEFDHLKRPTKRTLPLGQAETHTYDLAGNRTATTDFLGRITRFSYDENSRLTLKALPDGTRVVYTYTPAGQFATVSVSGNTSSAGLQNGTTRYQYGATDRLLRQDNPDGSILAYAYDPNGNRTEVSTSSGTTRYQYDAANRLVAVIAPTGEITRYGYDAAGNHSVISYPNNTRTIKEYDGTSQVTQIVHLRLPDQSNPSSAVLGSYRYAMKIGGQKNKADEYGPDAQVTVSGSAGTAEAGGSGAATLTATIIGTPVRTTEWTYDETDKLVQEKVTEPVGGAPTVTRTTSYTYDKVGNRKTKTEATTGLSTVTTYTYDGNDRLTQEVRSSGAGSVTTLYAWDAAGNLASKTEPSLYTGYSYDAENRLIEVKQGATQATAQSVATYGYDGVGNRIAKTVNGQRTTFLVDANQSFAHVLEETAGTGERTVYTRGLELVSQSSSLGTSYLYPDHLGSTRLLANAQGNTTATIVYEAFGQIVQQTGAPNTRFRFAGEYIDPETGLSYNRIRYLDLATGRFLSLDPSSGNAIEPTTLNKYLYAGANPLDGRDPSGAETLGGLSAAMDMGATLATNALRSITMDFVMEQLSKALLGGLISFKGRAGFGGSISGAGLVTSLAVMCRAGPKRCLLRGIPTLSTGIDMLGHSLHIGAAIFGGGNTVNRVPNPLPFVLTRVPFRNDVKTRTREWPCIGRVKAGVTNCDEYPYGSTLQGGQLNWWNDGVSLMALPAWESSRQGGVLSSFYSRAGVRAVPGTPQSFFLNIAIPVYPTFFIDRQGKMHFL